MAEIFISYARKDQAYVERVADHLQRAGFSVWHDVSQIRAGDEWQIKIERAIEECTVVIVVMSAVSVDSKWVNKEVELARRAGKALFPLLLEGDCFPSLNRLQYERVQGGLLPSLPLLVKIARLCGPAEHAHDHAPAETPYTDAHRQNDLRVLAEWWRIIHSGRFHQLEVSLSEENTPLAEFNELFFKLPKLWKEYPERHFVSATLEAAFEHLVHDLEDVGYRFGLGMETIKVKGKWLIVSQYALDLYPGAPDISEEQADYAQLRIAEAWPKFDALKDTHADLVRLIKTEFPEFSFAEERAAHWPWG
jgi:hypothetical protein